MEACEQAVSQACVAMEKYETTGSTLEVELRKTNSKLSAAEQQIQELQGTKVKLENLLAKKEKQCGELAQDLIKEQKRHEKTARHKAPRGKTLTEKPRSGGESEQVAEAEDAPATAKASGKRKATCQQKGGASCGRGESEQLAEEEGAAAPAKAQAGAGKRTATSQQEGGASRGTSTHTSSGRVIKVPSKNPQSTLSAASS